MAGSTSLDRVSSRQSTYRVQSPSTPDGHMKQARSLEEVEILGAVEQHYVVGWRLHVFTGASVHILWQVVLPCANLWEDFS